jgi:hypothetical protein
MATSICYNPTPMTLYEADGDRASGAKAYFYEARSTTPLSSFTDAPMTTPHPWPVVATGYGVLPPIYLAKGQEYKVRIEDAAGNILYAADGLDNPSEAESGGGGGGGIVTSAAQIHQTGDIVWNASAADREGWVRCNGKTISPTAGPGTAMNNDICQNLFKYFWDNFPDAICAVTPGGRGANAQADWDTSAKAIATLDMRGYGAAGLDDMGNSAAGFIQLGADITTTNGSTTIGVSGTGAPYLCIGMYILPDTPGVFPDGTFITSIGDVDVNLSAAATATTSGFARFSVFTDPQQPGAGGGDSIHILSVAELPVHSHANTLSVSASSTVNDPEHFHDVTTNADTSNQLVGRETPGTPAATYDMVSGASNDAISVAAIAASKATGITVTTTVTPTLTNVAAGVGAAMNIWTPTRLGTYWAKI